MFVICWIRKYKLNTFLGYKQKWKNIWQNGRAEGILLIAMEWHEFLWTEHSPSGWFPIPCQRTGQSTSHEAACCNGKHDYMVFKRSGFFS